MTFELGFETVGNATLIVHDRGPVLATDPWIEGGAYFGSWGLSHAIPEEQRRAIEECPYVWFSHGHPDHLNADSLHVARGKTVLVPDHRGGRIRSDLERDGFLVGILPDREWVRLSDRVRVLCIADYNQDAILLVEVGSVLCVDLNDASDRGWATFVRRTVRNYRRSFLMGLTNYGDADMMNLWSEDGKFLDPPAAMKWPIGLLVAEKLRTFGTSHFVPFSSLHRYVRKDSVWANAYAATLADYKQGLESCPGKVLPAFIRWDVARDDFVALDPPENPSRIVDPEEVGDHWDEPLRPEDEPLVARYFQRIEHLSTFLDFVRVDLGGREVAVPLAKKGFRRGVTFKAPRKSFMTAIEHGVFDDLLIGNFMKATLHGEWPATRLYPDFTPYVSKYADNGHARTKDELREYFKAYRKRAGLDYLRFHVEESSKNVFRRTFSFESRVYKLAKKVYWTVKAAA